MITLLAINHTTVEQTDNKFPRRPSDILPDEMALRRFVDLYWKRLLAYCQHYTQDKEASCEIVQDIFCSLWDKRGKTRINIGIEQYLFSAARNKIARYYRDRYRDERHHRNATSMFTEETNNTEEAVNFRDMQHHIANLVGMLPERCGEIFALSRNQGLAIREIAGKLSISEKTVETHLTKALKFLRKHLRNERY